MASRQASLRLFWLTALFLSLCLTATAQAQDFSGRWQVLGTDGKPYLNLTLEQNGSAITGRGNYSRGSIPIRGRVAAGRLELTQVFDNAQVLSLWLPAKVAGQVVGITSRLSFDTDGPGPYTGRSEGFYVWWDANQQVTRRAEGGTDLARTKNRPRAQTLRRIGPPPAAVATSAAQISGQWQLLKKGVPYVDMTLIQAGNSVRGKAVYKKGRARLQGRIEGHILHLTIHYDNAEVLTNWMTPGRAKQCIGITSLVEVDLNSGTDLLAATLKGFWITWTGTKVTAKYQGGSSEAARHNPPSPRRLRLVSAGPSITGPGGSPAPYPAGQDSSPQAATGPIKVTTAWPSYAPNQVILVRWSGLPGNAKDWVTVVKRGLPDNKYGEWVYTRGKVSGEHRFKGLPAGDYEVRVYLNWPNGGYDVAARHRFSVSAGAASGSPATGSATTGSGALDSAADLSGQWQLLKKGVPYVDMTLSQTGDTVQGTAIYKKGRARLQGRIEGRTLYLTIIYDNAEVLTNWLTPGRAEQCIGITSLVEVDLNAGTDLLKAIFKGFHVKWSGTKVTAKYKGGSAEAARYNPPAPRKLRRVSSGTASGGTASGGSTTGGTVSGGTVSGGVSPGTSSGSSSGSGSATSRNGDINLTTDQAVYRPGQAFTVSFSGLPGNAKDWITVVAKSAPPEKYGQWFYTNGRKAGRMEFKGLPAGEYEVRVYLNWPKGSYNVVARLGFKVGDAAATGGDAGGGSVTGGAAAGGAADLSGRWQLLDKNERPYVEMTLTQSGNTVQGMALYKKGRARLKGRIEGRTLFLTIIYDNPEVLTNWLNSKIAEQCVGITSLLEVDLNSGTDLLAATFKGFRVKWTGTKVTAKYQGGSAEAARHNPPSPRKLRRVSGGTSGGAVSGGTSGGTVSGGTSGGGESAWVTYIKSGRPFLVRLDLAKEKYPNDEGYTGDWRTDPLGTVKAGETYTLVYLGQGQFKTTGFNEAANGVVSHQDGGGDPDRHRLSMWGLVLEFDDQGRVLDKDRDQIGSLAKPDDQGAAAPAEDQVLARGSIGPQGGVIRVNKPGHPLNGLSVEIPAGAYPAARTVTISARPVPQAVRRAKINPVTPLISVDNGGGYAAQPMVIRFPLARQAGRFALPFFVDPAGGRLEGMPVLGYENGQLVALTRHFSSFFVSSISLKELLAPEVVHTGFEPGRDNWRFTNHGSILSPGGICAGMTLTAGWYYLEKFKKGAPPLRQALDNRGDNFATPDFGLDDSRGLRWASLAHIQQVSPANRAGYSVMNNWLQKGLSAMEQGVWHCFLYAMLVTGEPQYLAIYGQKADGKWYGHALLVYGADIKTGKLWVYDPNYDPAKGRTIYYDLSSHRFKSYISAGDADLLAKGKGIPFKRFYYYAKSAVINWPAIGRVWRDVEAGQAGQGKFPGWWLDIVDRQGKKLGRLTDGLTVKPEWMSLGRIRLKPDSNSQPYRSAFMFYRAQIKPGAPRSTAKAVPISKWITGGHSVDLTLNKGRDTIGVLVYGWDANGKGPDWSDFAWLNFRTGPDLTIKPDKVKGSPGLPIGFTATAEPSPEGRFEYIWDWGDKRTMRTGSQPAAAHTWDNPGRYRAKVYLKDLATQEVLAQAEAEVTIVGGQAATQPPTDDGCPPELEAKCRAKNFAGLECLKCKAKFIPISPCQDCDQPMVFEGSGTFVLTTRAPYGARHVARCPSTVQVRVELNTKTAGSRKGAAIILISGANCDNITEQGGAGCTKCGQLAFRGSHDFKGHFTIASEQRKLRITGTYDSRTMSGSGGGQRPWGRDGAEIQESINFKLTRVK